MIRFEDDSNGNPQILVIGLGGAALRAVNTIAGWKLKGVETAFIDTDPDTIKNCISAEKFYLRRQLVKQIEDELKESEAEGMKSELTPFISGLKKSEMVFTITGLGGATGTTVIPYLVGALKEMSQWVFSLVTLPFFFEGKPKIINSIKGLKRLQTTADAVLAVQHDKVFKMVDKNISMHEAFIPANNIYTKMISSIYRLTLPAGWVSIGFSEIKKSLGERHDTAKNSGPGICSKTTAFGVGEASGSDKVNKAMENAMNDSLLGRALLSGSRNILVSILGGEDLKLKEVQTGIEFLNTLIPGDTKSSQGVHSSCGVNYGIATDALWNEKVEISIIASGIDTAVHDISSNWDLSVGIKKDEKADVRKTILAPAKGQSLTKPFKLIKSVSKPQQTTIDFKSGSKGYFDRSKPTLRDGDNLDIPTFIRKKEQAGVLR